MLTKPSPSSGVGAVAGGSTAGYFQWPETNPAVCYQRQPSHFTTTAQLPDFGSTFSPAVSTNNFYDNNNNNHS